MPISVIAGCSAPARCLASSCGPALGTSAAARWRPSLLSAPATRLFGGTRGLCQVPAPHGAADAVAVADHEPGEPVFHGRRQRAAVIGADQQRIEQQAGFLLRGANIPPARQSSAQLLTADPLCNNVRCDGRTVATTSTCSGSIQTLRILFSIEARVWDYSRPKAGMHSGAQRPLLSAKQLISACAAGRLCWADELCLRVICEWSLTAALLREHCRATLRPGRRVRVTRLRPATCWRRWRPTRPPWTGRRRYPCAPL